MKIKNSMQLKALIKKKAVEKKISPQLVMQNYMLERLLERISLSKYSHNFILKGGYLISSIVGLETRTTMDLDTTIKGFTLTHESVGNIFKDICDVEVDDNIQFEIINTSDICEGDRYPGIRAALKATYVPISVPLNVDITTGDVITPREIEYSFQSLFDAHKIHILAYSIETVLAEKIETVLSREVANTRLRDFYDIYVLYRLHDSDFDINMLKLALIKTMKKRESVHLLENYSVIMKNIHKDEKLQNLWIKYQQKFNYANDISFDNICNTIQYILEMIMK